MKIAEQISRLRARAGMSQGELADRLEVSRQSVSKWETGASVPEIDKLVKMSALFGVTLDELVNKPLAAAVSGTFAIEEGRICGVLEISPESTIPLPDPVMEMFDFHCGDKVLLLGDRKQGLALVKCSKF